MDETDQSEPCGLSLSASTTMSPLTQSDKYALAFQLVAQLTSLVDGTIFAKRMAVLRNIKEAWEKNKEVTIVTEEDNFVCGDQLNLAISDMFESVQNPQLGPDDSNVGSSTEKQATFQAVGSPAPVDVVVKQEMPQPGMPRIEQVVSYGLPALETSEDSGQASSFMDESGCSVAGSMEEEHPSMDDEDLPTINGDTLGIPQPGESRSPANGVPPCPANGVPTCPANGIPPCPSNGMPTCPANGMPPCPAYGVPPCPANGVPTCPAYGVPPCPANGVPPCPTNGVPPCPANGMPPCPANGVPPCPAKGMPSCPANGDTPSNLLPADQIMSALREMKCDMQQLIAGQKALRVSVKHLYSAVTPKSVPSSQTQHKVTFAKNTSCTTTLRCASTQQATSSSHQRPAATVTPLYIAGPETGTFLLGGTEGLVRDISDYHVHVRKVSSRGASKPESMGRILCSLLMRNEFSNKELASKNVTGKSRDPLTKKSLVLPKLDENILRAIFRQARLQFPGFRDHYTDGKCQTVQLLNDTCKHIRRTVLLENLMSVNDSGGSIPG